MRLDIPQYLNRDLPDAESPELASDAAASPKRDRLNDLPGEHVANLVGAGRVSREIEVSAAHPNPLKRKRDASRHRPLQRPTRQAVADLLKRAAMRLGNHAPNLPRARAQPRSTCTRGSLSSRPRPPRSVGRWLTSPMELTIRDATRADADGVAALLADLGYPASTEAAAAHIARFTEDPASRLQVAATAGGLIGLVATHIVPRLDDDRFSCRVTDIVVSASHRRSGIGSALMTAAEHEARRTGAPRLDLSSGEWRADAYAFYTRLGFETRSRGFTKRLAHQP